MRKYWFSQACYKDYLYILKYRHAGTQVLVHEILFVFSFRWYSFLVTKVKKWDMQNVFPGFFFFCFSHCHHVPILHIHQQSWRHLRMKALSLSFIITSSLTFRSLWAVTCKWWAGVVLSFWGCKGVVRYWWRCWIAAWILILAANASSSSVETDEPEVCPYSP